MAGRQSQGEKEGFGVAILHSAAASRRAEGQASLKGVVECVCVCVCVEDGGILGGFLESTGEERYCPGLCSHLWGSREPLFLFFSQQVPFFPLLSPIFTLKCNLLQEALLI